MQLLRTLRQLKTAKLQASEEKLVPIVVALPARRHLRYSCYKTVTECAGALRLHTDLPTNLLHAQNCVKLPPGEDNRVQLHPVQPAAIFFSSHPYM